MSSQKILRTTIVLALGVILLGFSEKALADPTVRDHRGTNGEAQGGVTVTTECSRANPCGGGRPRPRRHLPPQAQPNDLSGATVRDHRSIPCLGNLC